MTMCQFCHRYFFPRPQVKSPRACSSPECQRKRQRLNEHEWHERHRGIYDKSYHRVKKILRKRRVRVFLDQLKRAIDTGARFTGVLFDLPAMMSSLEGLFMGLGIRQINKLCNPGKTGV